MKPPMKFSLLFVLMKDRSKMTQCHLHTTILKNKSDITLFYTKLTKNNTTKTAFCQPLRTSCCSTKISGIYGILWVSERYRESEESKKQEIKKAAEPLSISSFLVFWFFRTIF